MMNEGQLPKGMTPEQQGAEAPDGGSMVKKMLELGFMVEVGDFAALTGSGLEVAINLMSIAHPDEFAGAMVQVITKHQFYNQAYAHEAEAREEQGAPPMPGNKEEMEAMSEEARAASAKMYSNPEELLEEIRAKADEPA